MTPNLNLRLHELEAALQRHAFLELSVDDALKLRKAFLKFKDRLVAAILSREEPSFGHSLVAEAVDKITTYNIESKDPSRKAIQGTSQVADKKAQVLLAEHDTKVAAFFIKHLHAAGYDVLWSSHARMAKTLIHNGNPDAIICGVYSSRSFGKEVLTFVRKRSAPYIPVLLVGGAEHCDALRDTIHLGADDYLAQHITAAEIIGKVKQLLKQ